MDKIYYERIKAGFESKSAGKIISTAKQLQKNKSKKLHKKMLKRLKKQVTQKQKLQIYLVFRRNMLMHRKLKNNYNLILFN